MSLLNADKIFALATPPGMSAIAVIRISGDKALQVPHLFDVEAGAVRTAKRVFLKDESGTIIDDVMVLGFAAPASATGEDVLEIHCHGSVAVIDDILSVLAKTEGFRAAEPGEFTRRALDNGKTDSKAEKAGEAEEDPADIDYQLARALDLLRGLSVFDQLANEGRS